MRRRTKFAAAVVLTISTGACHIGTSNPPAPDDDLDAGVDMQEYPVSENPPPPALRVESYDVIVGAETTAVMPRFTSDYEYCLPLGVDVLPDVGECNDQGDAESFACGLQNDVTEVSVDGVMTAPNTQNGSATVVVNSSASSVLHLNGVYGPVDVPLHASGLPTPTLTTTPRSDGVDIAWTTDVPAASSLVEVTSGLVVRHCQVTAQSYAFTGMTPSGIRVQPFLAVETHETPYGEIRVWRGNGKATQ